MAIVNNRPRSGTATTKEDSWLLSIDSRTFGAMIRARTEIAVRMMKALAARLEQANQQIELLLVKDANHRVVRCLRQLAGPHVEAEGPGVHIPITLESLASRVALEAEQVRDVVSRLRQARLVLTAQECGLEGEGFVVPEVGRLGEFLEFLQMKERLTPG
jgi:CRP/FNR family transcriptional regulator, cyclic AMP receptor protein